LLNFIPFLRTTDKREWSVAKEKFWFFSMNFLVETFGLVKVATFRGGFAFWGAFLELRWIGCNYTLEKSKNV